MDFEIDRDNINPLQFKYQFYFSNFKFVSGEEPYGLHWHFYLLLIAIAVYHYSNWEQLLIFRNTLSIDLHCHLRGTIRPELALRLAKKNGLELPSRLRHHGYEFEGFDDFLKLYDLIGKTVNTGDDLKQIAQTYLLNCAKNGTAYVEFMISPAHSMANGISFQDQISAISDAIDYASNAIGIAATIIITAVRHRDPGEATEVATLAANSGNQKVVGFGLTGNERFNNVLDFQKAFRIAGDAGLGLTAHAGEWMEARTILNAVELLGLSRVGHGIRAVDDKVILYELRDRQIGFEVCLSSNVRLGAAPSFRMHPVCTLVEAGCLVSLATDDPEYFETSPDLEMEIGELKCGLSKINLKKILIDSVEMAFCSYETKAKILDKIQ